MIRVAIPALLLMACLGAGVPVIAQDAGVVFRAGISLIRLDTEALDSAGLTLTDLKKEDFRVFDEGNAQPIVNFSFENEALDLVLLFDTSGSMKGKLGQVVRAVELGFHELKQGDRVCVMAFQRDAFEVAPFTTDLNAVNETILLKVLSLHFAGSSNSERAATGAAQRFRSEPKNLRRRAVLIVTDRAAAGSDSAVGPVRALWQEDAVLSELVIAHAPQTQVLERGANVIAGMTGGATVVAGDPGPSFQQALRLLRRRYTLWYAAPGGLSGSERHTEVRLSADAAKRLPGAHVRARTGYLVP